ncbi:MAG: O-antigen ligase family protein [Alphaproteobacteria bacterium]|nr:O-antigen ligase family protein [Alphaproteobacteria bacterium]
MKTTSLSTDTLFFGAFTLFFCMHYAITVPAPHSIIFYGLVVPLALAYLWQHKSAGRMLISHPSWRWVMVFFIYIIVHALVLAGEHEGASKVIRNTIVTAIFFSVVALQFSVISTQNYQRLMVAVALSAGICGTISIALYFTDPNAEIRMRPIGRADAQLLAAFVYIIAAICAMAALDGMRKKWLSALLIFSLCICVAVVSLTQSRLALAILLLCLVIGGGFICRNHRIWLATFVIGLIVIIAGALSNDILMQHVHTMLDRGDSYRLELWGVTIQKIMQSPWQGYGMLAGIDYHMTETYHTNSPHNIYLTTALTLGVPGLVILLMAIGNILWEMLRQLPWFSHAMIFSGLLLLDALASGMVDHSRIVKGPSPLWIIFWLPLAVGVGTLIRSHRLHNSEPDADEISPAKAEL